MKKVFGWTKAIGMIEVKDNATDLEIKQALAEHLSYEYFCEFSSDGISLVSESEFNNIINKNYC